MQRCKVFIYLSFEAGGVFFGGSFEFSLVLCFFKAYDKQKEQYGERDAEYGGDKGREEVA